MSKVASINQVLDMMAVSVAPRNTKNQKTDTDFKALLSDALGSQQPSKEDLTQTGKANQTGKAIQSAKDVQQDSNTATRPEASKTQTDQTTEKATEQTSEKADSSGKTDAVDEAVIAAMAAIAIPVLPEIVVEVNDVETTREQTHTVSHITTAPPEQLSTGPIVTTVTPSPMQYAAMLAEAQTDTPDEVPQAPENQILIDKVEVIVTDSGKQNTPAVDANAMVGQAQITDSGDIIDPRQQRFDDMLANAAKGLADLGQPEAETHPPPQTVPPELRAEVPKETVQQRNLAPVIREVEKNMTRVNRTDQEILKAPVSTIKEELVAPPVTTAAVWPMEAPLEVQQANPVNVPQPIQQIEAEVIRNLDNQNMEFRMQLSPEELGKIDVRMIMESGRITVEIIASSQKTAALLAKNTDGLMAAHRINSVDLQSVQVVAQTQGQTGHMEQAFNMGQSNLGAESQPQENQSTKSTTGDGTGAQQNQDSQEETAAAPSQLLNYAI